MLNLHFTTYAVTFITDEKVLSFMTSEKRNKKIIFGGIIFASLSETFITF
jgi:hypothetical protein